ncbi:MAG: HEAT repeat domain-containing protein [Phycisphaerales bacterium]|nr:MAG: HEAT repeat domain-containing protein [Phycisphaerales bacterium]
MIPVLTPVFFVEIALKGLLLLALAYVLATLCQRRSASARHLVWSLGLASTLMLPALSYCLPSIDVLVIQERAMRADRNADMPEAEPRALFAPARDQADISTGSGGPVTLARIPAVFSDDSRSVQWGPPVGLLVVAWMAIVGLSVTRLLVDTWRLMRLTGRANLAVGSERSHLIESLKRQMGVTRQVRIVTSPALPLPITWGIFRAVILLPATQDQWSENRRRLVLLHELAHVKRWDYVWNLVGLLARAVHWYNPLTWIAYRRLGIERERAADDCVLQRRVESREYASHLLAIACSLRRRSLSARCVSAMADHMDFKGRVQALLDSRVSRNPLSRLTAGVVLSLTVVLLGPLAAAHLRGRQLKHDPAAPFSQVVAPDPLVRAGMGGPRSVHRPTHLVEQAIAGLSQAASEVRARSAWILGERESPKAVGPLVMSLGDEDPEVRGMAAWALGEIKDTAALPALNKALGDEDPLAREMVVMALGEIRQPESVEALTPLVTDGNRSIRAAAVRALGEIGTFDALDVVTSALADPDTRVRNEAARALGSKGRAQRVPFLLTALARDEDSRVRQSIARALGDINNPAGIPGLIAVLDDADGSVRTEAARSLGRIRDPLAVDALIRSSRDEDPEVRWMVAWALDEIRQR